MTIDEAMNVIHNAEKLGSIMGVETVREMLIRLGNPQDNLKVIHIAGTNGKGSTLAMISSILTNAGYKVGRYISPTLVSYYERFQIDEVYITENDFAKVMDIVKPVYDSMINEGYTPTAFEIETVIAFVYFNMRQCDFVVLECGMGGTYDATNVLDNPLVCVFASIGLDHMGILGDTVAKIAKNKSGIIKAGTKVCTTIQDSDVMEVLAEKCLTKDAKLFVSDPKKDAGDVVFYNPFDTNRADVCTYTSFVYKNNIKIDLPLSGTYQIINACNAISCIEVLRELGYNVSNENIVNGIKATRWFGRLTLIGINPFFFVDGAHNKPAAKVLAESVNSCIMPYLGDKKLIYIMGCFADKDYDNIIDIMVPMADKIFTIKTPRNVRAMDEVTLCEHINIRRDIAIPMSTIDKAVKAAISENDGNVVVLAFGSLSHLNEIREAYNYK